MDAIRTRKLTKYYGKARGILEVDLQVREGEIFGFIGPNGAGKSTTIRTLLALIHKTSGEAQIFGRDCARDYREILKDVGYLPSEVNFYDKMRARDLLRYAASFYEQDCRARMQSLAQVLDLDLDRRIEDMSLGNRKKVGIVQGLMHQPRLIILDEPTSGLDPLMQKAFFDLMLEENRRGATIFFSSHILNEVQRICSRVAIIREGRIVETEQISELIQNTYKKVALQLAAAGEAGAERTATLQALPGIAKFERSDDRIDFIFNGEVNQLLSTLAGLDLRNIEISEPSLEEVFMHFYE